MSDELLSQDEIEALLAGVSNPGAASIPSADSPADSFTASTPQTQEPPHIEMVSTQPTYQAPPREPKPETVARTVQFAPLDNSVNSGMVNGVDLILDVQLQVAVELGRAQMKVREVLGLGPGSVVELDKHAGEPVEVVVNNKTIAKGEVVVIDENFGVRITEIVSSQRNDANAKAA